MSLLTRPYDLSALPAADRLAIELFNRPHRWFTRVLAVGLVGAWLLLAPVSALGADGAWSQPVVEPVLRFLGVLLLQRAVLEQCVRLRLELPWIDAYILVTVPFDLLAAGVLARASVGGLLDVWVGGAATAACLASAAPLARVALMRLDERKRARFANVAGVTWSQPLLPLLRWRLERTWRRRRGSEALPDVVTPCPARLREATPHLTWVGHATFVMRLGGALVATDPIWRGRLYSMGRLRPPGVPIDRLPSLDLVTVSHNHYDHLDLESLVELGRRYRPKFLVPRNNGWILRRSGLTDVVELDWWDSLRVRGLEVTLVPAQHWSQRGPFDTNCGLWGGFVYSSSEGTAYHAGDTAFEPELFRRIAARFVIDWAMLPIAAYDPAWFLRTQHLNPEEAGRAFELLCARVFVAMHYGTYALTDEPVGEPAERLRAWFEARGALPRLWCPAIGETRSLAA